MSRNEQWKKIRSNIAGLRNSASIYADFNAGNSRDMFGSYKILAKHCLGIWKDIEKYQEDYEQQIPRSAAEKIREFDGNLITVLSNNTTQDGYIQAMRTAVIGLISLAGC